MTLLFKYCTYRLKVKHKLLCAYFSVVVHEFRILNRIPRGAKDGLCYPQLRECVQCYYRYFPAEICLG